MRLVRGKRSVRTRLSRGPNVKGDVSVRLQCRKTTDQIGRGECVVKQKLWIHFVK